jgi:hypothetical protein
MGLKEQKGSTVKPQDSVTDGLNGVEGDQAHFDPCGIGVLQTDRRGVEGRGVSNFSRAQTRFRGPLVGLKDSTFGRRQTTPHTQRTRD